MNKISFCDENREKRNVLLVIEGLNRFLSLKLTTLARSFTYIPAKKKLGMFFCLPLSYSKSKNNTLWENSRFIFYYFFLIC